MASSLLVRCAQRYFVYVAGGFITHQLVYRVTVWSVNRRKEAGKVSNETEVKTLGH